MMRSLFPQIIRTKRTVLTRITMQDALGWKSFNNKIASVMQWDIVPSIVYARNELLHYSEMWERGERYVYIVKERSTGKIIGDFHLKSLDAKRKRMEFGHALHPRVWGTGITYELMDAVRKKATKRNLVLWGKVEEQNIRSWKSLEKYKARFIGRRWYAVNGKNIRMRVYEL